MSKYILGDIFKGDYPITQNYGDNPQIYTMFIVPGHEGVDWGTPDGTEVIAPFDGIILRDTFGDKDYGNFTVIWDPVQHCAVWYCHLQDVTTTTGDKVTTGQVVGHTNNTGHSTGPHLHVDFVETDPLGNRLNKDNGKQGFLDILDPKLVEWGSSANQAQPLPQPIPAPTPQPTTPVEQPNPAPTTPVEPPVTVLVPPVTIPLPPVTFWAKLWAIIVSIFTNSK